jgi:predicted phage terminase large subunit-like protein
MNRNAIDQAWLDRLERLTTPRLTRYIAHRPTPPQTAFLLLECREAMYGGAAGGGKSDALLMAALQYVDVPDYAALLLRKSYSHLSLPAALIPRAAEWLAGTDAKWNGAEHVWRFPFGASLSFGYLDTEADKYRYQSAEYQFIGFDELTQFSESQYTYMFSRLRRLKGSSVPLRMLGASNPGGYGHEWVKQRFITRRCEGGRIFIPAKLNDNPYLDQDEYRTALGELDSITRAQLLNGDWAIASGQSVFKRSWFPTFRECPKPNRIILSWDTAFKEGEETDYSVCQVWAEADAGFYLRDLWRGRVEYPELKRQAVALDAKWNPELVLIEDKASGQSLIQELRRDTKMPLRAIKVDRDKKSRAHAVTGLIEAGRVYLPERAPWVADFLDEVCAFDQGSHDDQVDSMTQALNYLRHNRNRLLDFYIKDLPAMRPSGPSCANSQCRKPLGVTTYGARGLEFCSLLCSL